MQNESLRAMAHRIEYTATWIQLDHVLMTGGSFIECPRTSVWRIQPQWRPLGQQIAVSRNVECAIGRSAEHMRAKSATPKVVQFAKDMMVQALYAFSPRKEA